MAPSRRSQQPSLSFYVDLFGCLLTPFTTPTPTPGGPGRLSHVAAQSVPFMYLPAAL